ncbi:MAG TPA: alpha/beta hydrolase [Caulobacteraceae bacterium]|jgi:alpha-beta hydrolase superfamily lysophospholipase|nr:alpha/beta hydrolase [Caulobacteraceae bacterium]
MAALVHADERLKAEIPSITLPLLVLHGAADKAALPVGSQHLFDHAGSSDKKFRLYRDRFHDMLNDLGKEDVRADIIEWIDKRIPA